MSDIIEHYGKVVVALVGALAAITLTVAVVKSVKTSTALAVKDLSYSQYVEQVTGDELADGDTGNVVDEGNGG
jgi:hypothetical protein